MKTKFWYLTDFYKVDHRSQYPDNTTMIYSNLTARGSRTGFEHNVFFGLQYFIKKYLNQFLEDLRAEKDNFQEYQNFIYCTLGQKNFNVDHLKYLKDLDYIPLEIRALTEGTLVPTKVPFLTINNTDKKSAWLTNFVETLLSNVLWMPITSATTAYRYRKIFEQYADKTIGNRDFVQWQGHDFSFRGMSGVESAALSGAGHLLSFTGTDTIPAIKLLEKYYDANPAQELVGASVPATEHSVMCAGGKENELETFKRLITQVYPEGIVSIVSDTWDLWNVLTNILPKLKQEILAREGKIVIRPDSGNPVDILCGNSSSDDRERKGVVELLWDVFGGTINSKGYKELDSHVGYIYGDSITLDRAEEICKRLEAKGFASQGVFGIGSFTYQYVTRDTYNMAVKSTYCKINGEPRDIFKSPITDSGTKKSLKGLISVDEKDGKLFAVDESKGTGSALRTVYFNGQLTKEFSLKEIRKILWK
jgi:nicotinamide phosphoribosyltransferase